MNSLSFIDLFVTGSICLMILTAKRLNTIGDFVYRLLGGNPPPRVPPPESP